MGATYFACRMGVWQNGDRDMKETWKSAHATSHLYIYTTSYVQLNAGQKFEVNKLCPYLAVCGDKVSHYKYVGILKSLNDHKHIAGQRVLFSISISSLFFDVGSKYANTQQVHLHCWLNLNSFNYL